MSHKNGKPLVAITGGDPAGIAPEITLKAVAMKSVRDVCIPVVVGSAGLLVSEKAASGVALEVRVIDSLGEVGDKPGTIDVLETGELEPGTYERGRNSAICGKFSGDTIVRAVGLAMAGEVRSVVVAPNSKKALNMGGYHFPGFEEIITHYTGTTDSIQILMGRHYNLARVSNHMPLSQVSAYCTRERVLSRIVVLDKSLKAVGIDAPRIGVSALNPHIGEEGLLGTEEIEHIIPACEDARARGIDAIGPLPADTVFLDMKEGRIDVVLSMYHDHGNACIKLVEFGYLVNFIGGLPVPVFTVSHGTAFDIAGQGKADPTNLEWSILAAAGHRPS